MKARNLLSELKRARLLLLVLFALVGLLVLHKAGALAPPKIEHWSISRLAHQLEREPSILDQAREALLQSTPSRMEIIRHLLAGVEYGKLHEQAATELGARGPAASNAVCALVRSLAHEGSVTAADAEFRALGKIGPAAHRAVPDLVEWLAKPPPDSLRDPGIRVWEQGAAWALVRIAPEDPRVGTAMVKALAACAAERSRAWLRPGEFTEPTDLRNLPDSGNQGWPSTRRSLIKAIGRIRPQNSQTLAALFHELHDGDYAAQATAADVLGEIYPTSPDVVAALTNALLRTEAEHLPAWRELAALTPPHLDAAHRASFKVDPAPEVLMVFGEAPDSIAERLDTIYFPGAGFPGWGLRLRVIRSLGRIGSPAREVLPSLLRECQSETKPSRFDAAVAVWRICGNSPEAIAAFERGLQASKLESRELALARLSDIAAELPRAITLLSYGLQDPDLQIRWRVLHLLGALGTNGASALPAVEALTNDPKILIRMSATAAVQLIQPVRLPR
jgi:HEAT repeat protein